MIRSVALLLTGGAISAAATFPLNDIADPPLTKSDAERIALSYQRSQSQAFEFQRRAHAAELTVELQTQVIARLAKDRHAPEFATEPSPLVVRPEVKGADLIPAQQLPTGRE